MHSMLPVPNTTTTPSNSLPPIPNITATLPNSTLPSSIPPVTNTTPPSKPNIIYPTASNPFIINRNQIITPICTRGYTGAVVIKLVLEKMIGVENVRAPYGITADPEFASTDNITRTDVTVTESNDEFEKVFGYRRNDRLQNAQTIIIDQLNAAGITNISRNNETYCEYISKNVWNFRSDKQRVFILMTMCKHEINAAVKNITDTDILVIFHSYNTIAYPPYALSFSEKAYRLFVDKVNDYFVMG